MTKPACRRPSPSRWIGASLSLLLLVAAPVWSAPTAADPSAVVDAYHAALKNRDTRAALDLMAEDAVLFEQGFVERGRAAYAGAHVTADSDFAANTRSTVTNRKVIWLGDQAACVLSETRTTGSYQNQRLDLVGTETAVLRRSGDGWLIQHLHTSAHPAPEADPAAAGAGAGAGPASPTRPAPK